MKKVLWIFCCVAIAYLSACQSNHSSTDSSDSTKQYQANNDTTPVEIGKDIVISDQESFVKEIHRPTQKLIGREVSLTMKNLPATIANLLPEITQVIQKQNLIISGTLTVVYLDDQSLKSPSEITKVFIGIPVRIKKATPLQYYEIPEGDFFKGIVNAPIGESTPDWKKYLDRLNQAGNQFQGPRFEYYSDARNSEMTTVMSQTSMMVRKK